MSKIGFYFSQRSTFGFVAVKLFVRGESLLAAEAGMHG